jgi:sarcosine oxidase
MLPDRRMTTYDFIIAGLGTAGAATCMTLARRGFRVLGIDPYRPPHKMGSHHGASRSVRRAYLEGTAYVPMAMRSWDLWRRLEKETGQTLLVQTGNLTIGPPESPAVSGFMASARAYGIPHEALTAADVRKRWPQLVPPDTFVAGLEKEAGIVFPEMSVAAFLAEAEKAGAGLVADDRLIRWTEGNGHVHVQTAHGTYETGRLLVAAGAWTRGLLDLPVGILTPKRVPVHWIAPPPGGAFDLGRFPVNFWQVPAETRPGSPQAYREFYTLPSTGPDIWVKAAFHNELVDCDPDTLVRTVAPDELEKINTVLSQWLPGLDRRSMTSEVCLYTLTPDGHFYLGRRPGSAHVFGVALAGHGFKFAPVLGEILADLMTDIAPSVDIDLFSPQRFQPG